MYVYYILIYNKPKEEWRIIWSCGPITTKSFSSVGSYTGQISTIRLEEEKLFYHIRKLIPTYIFMMPFLNPEQILPFKL